MAFTKALWLPSTAYLPEADRLSLGSLWYQSGSTTSLLDHRAGVLPRGLVSTRGPLQVYTTSGLISTIAPGQMVLPGWVSDAQGTYVVTNDAATTVTHATAHATLPRIDTVYVQVTDTNFSGGSNTTVVAIQLGTAASSPVAPAIPTGAYALADVRINAASATITSITDRRTYTTTTGSPVLCSGSNPANPYDGQMMIRTDQTPLRPSIAVAGTWYGLTRVDEWQAVVVAQLRQVTTATSLTTGVATAVAWDTEDYDPLNGWVVGSPTRYTFQAAGRYECAGAIGFASNVTGRRGAIWRVNGVDVNGGGSLIGPVSGGPACAVARTIVVNAAAGDYIELQGYQESGGALLTSLGTWEQPGMTIKHVGV